MYNHRPLWDIVVIAFMIGGTALCVTALVLAWRAVGRRLSRAAQRVLLAAAVLALFVGPGAAAAAAQTTLAEVKSLRCTFTRRRRGAGRRGTRPRPPCARRHSSSGSSRSTPSRGRPGCATARWRPRSPCAWPRICISCRHSGPGRSIQRQSSPRAPPLGASRRRIPATNSSRRRCPAQPRALSSPTEHAEQRAGDLAGS